MLHPASARGPLSADSQAGYAPLLFLFTKKRKNETGKNRRTDSYKACPPMVGYRKLIEGGILMLCLIFGIGTLLLSGLLRLARALRLSVPLLYGALVITVFRPWYLAHTALADGLFFVLVGIAALSWAVSLIRAVRDMVG